MKKVTSIKIVLILLLLGAITRVLPVSAGTGSVTLDSKSDWQAGINVNTDLNNPNPPIGGDVRINPSNAKIDLKTIYDIDNTNLTVTMHDENKTNVFDGNIDTAWGGTICSGVGCGGTALWTLKLNGAYNINQFRVVREVLLGGAYIYTSTDGVNFSLQVTTMGYKNEGWQTYDISPPVSASYLRIKLEGGGMPAPQWVANLYELEAYGQPLTATHVSAASQIDGTPSFKSWDTFVPVATIPDKTQVGFRFRTSPDSSNWSAWSASIPYASSISLFVVVQQRYLQVETTLQTTDQTLTPALQIYKAFYTSGGGGSGGGCPGVCPPSITSWSDDYKANLCQTVHATVLTGDTATFITVTDIKPAHPDKAAGVELVVTGTHLDALTEARLAHTGVADIVGTIVNATPSSASISFDLTNAANGSWDLKLTNNLNQISLKNNAIEITSN